MVFCVTMVAWLQQEVDSQGLTLGDDLRRVLTTLLFCFTGFFGG